MKIKIAVAQLNPIVGDLQGNYDQIIAAYVEAATNGADMVIAPECVLTGYPLEDLVLRESFMEAVTAKVDELCAFVGERGFETSLIFGAPQKDARGVMNCAFVVDPKDHGQHSCNFVSKYELPNYGVFDEKRVFHQGLEPKCIEWRGKKIGLMICEDAWFPTVSNMLYKDDAIFLISINGSPFEMGKNVTRRRVIAKRIKQTGLPFLYVNLVGGQDELVFDGGSFLYDGAGVQEAPQFKTGVFYFKTELREERRYESYSWGDPPPEPIATLDNYPMVEPTGLAEVYQALVMGTRDYMTKQGFKSAVLGYSGGVDSGLVAAIVCDAFGPKNVHLVRLPSKFSSDHSLTDAEEGAERLGAFMRTINIEPVVSALRRAYESTKDSGVHLIGPADENIQARARGNILMSISNQEGHLLLTTGNKSEVSVGYSTLYGDMSGGFNPVKDCYKTTVWDLCRWRNAQTASALDDYGFLGRGGIDVVPEEIIVKPPSAELKPDQKDEDSLPPYPVLDAMLKGMIENELSVTEITEKLDIPRETVDRIRRLVDLSEYKRRQAAPGVKITSKIHGRDRRYPIVNRWRG